ncbi:hypothetical protein ACRC6Q_11120 [Planococcus sp. SE5232]|uniref:hypothetical protein n=1 Tax=unclassified Planococcus (in: firmicutes) TaxID=2662419 RepID=UPI003D6C15EF
MDFLKNQKGYALLMVMLLVVLFTILGMGLLTMNINASKQFNLKEEQVEARHLSEMGILHYHNVLETVVSANTTDLKCTKIEPLLQIVNADSKSDSKYEVAENGYSGNSCIERGGTLEVKVQSKSEGDLDTEKIITATYFVKNKGTHIPGNGSSTPSSPIVPTKPITNADKLTTWNKSCDKSGQKKCKDAHETIQEFTEVTMIEMKQNSLHFKDSLVMDNLVVNGGNGATLKVDKNMYVSNEIDVQNHACIAVGQNLVVKQNMESVNKLSMVVYRDTYLPQVLGSTSPNNEMYVFGNVFLPSGFSLPPKIGKMKIYVKGNVYKIAGETITKIANPFGSMSQNQANIANRLPCANPGLEQPITTPTVPSAAFWELEDDPLIDYK